MDFEIAIVYREDMPEQLVLDLKEDLRKLNVRVKVEERENAPFIAIEWAIPAAIILILTKSYLDGFVKEIGKEHYLTVKKSIAGFARKVLRIQQETIVSSNAPNKISKDNPVSKSFAIWTQSLGGTHLRFLFLNYKSDNFYNHCSDKVFDALMNHAQEFPNDYISNQIDRLAKSPHEVYLLFDESADEWRIVDIQTENFTEQ